MWSYSLSNHNHCRSFQFLPLYHFIGRESALYCMWISMFGPTPMEKVYYCDKTRLMAQNKGHGPLWVTSSLTNGLNLSEIEPISAPNSIQRDVDDGLQKDISRSINVQLSAGYKISWILNQQFNVQLSAVHQLSTSVTTFIASASNSRFLSAS